MPWWPSSPRPAPSPRSRRARRRARPTTLSAGAGLLLSYQPGGYEGPGSPYLSKNLGGTRPGLSLALQRRHAGQPLLALELSTTLPFQAVQSGRFVVQTNEAKCQFHSCIALGSHRDTLLTLLVGTRFGGSGGGGVLDVEVGPSLVLARTRQDDHVWKTAAGHFALTGGLASPIPVSDRLSLVPAVRYSYVLRGPDMMYVGIDHSIWRFSLGLRARISKAGGPRQ